MGPGKDWSLDPHMVWEPKDREHWSERTDFFRAGSAVGMAAGCIVAKVAFDGLGQRLLAFATVFLASLILSCWLKHRMRHRVWANRCREAVLEYGTAPRAPNPSYPVDGRGLPVLMCGTIWENGRKAGESSCWNRAEMFWLASDGEVFAYCRLCRYGDEPVPNGRTATEEEAVQAVVAAQVMSS